jgi:ubiquinone/menaquinone biosynthesis C-methylase UbiE
VPEIVAVDLGCGTGLSSRTLAEADIPTENGAGTRQINRVLGIDLSPYYIEVGKTLLSKAPLPNIMIANEAKSSHAWVNPITVQSKNVVELRVANAADTELESNSVDVVNLLFVLHELPEEAAVQVITEAHRILKPGGQLWMGEMDFQAPAYAAQRANALLFSLIRATEPYLDQYADHFDTHIKPTIERLFETVVWRAATGRHYAMVATKHDSDSASDRSLSQTETATTTTTTTTASVKDYRFLPNGEYAIQDTHLQLWESKEIQ